MALCASSLHTLLATSITACERVLPSAMEGQVTGGLASESCVRGRCCTGLRTAQTVSGRGVSLRSAPCTSHNWVMPKPQPLSADRIPDGSKLDAFNAAYREAKRAGVPFVCVMRSSGTGWTVKVDVLSAPVWEVDEQDAELLRETVVCLVRERIVDSGASAGPEYLAMHGVADERQAPRTGLRASRRTVWQA